jgi:hypothetical protein
MNHKVHSELINATITVYPSHNPPTIPLPGPGTYSILAKTIDRGGSVAVAYSYDYWQNTSSSDKFGVVWSNVTKTSGWSLWWGSGGLNGNLGITNDNLNVDRIFVVPSNAISADIVVASTDQNLHNTGRSVLNVVVSNANIPEPPKPPIVGTFVKCSNYSSKETAQMWGDSEGHSWLDAFGSSNYSLSITDKYTTYTFPTNLTVINQSADICKVV